MPASIEDVLDAIESATREPARIQEAEERLQSLIEDMSETDLSVWQDDLRRTIAHFHKKRARRLTEVLDSNLDAARRSAQGETPADRRETLSDRRPTDRASEFANLLDAFVESLADLSRSHIFQWATYYRELLTPYFDRFFRAELSSRRDDDFMKSAGAAIAAHSKEIFTKGFLHVTRTESAPYAELKSLNGLQRFLDLPLEYYSTTLGATSNHQHAALRRVASRLLGGVLVGYSAVKFERRSGADMLALHPNHWGHTLAFLDGSDLSGLLGALPAGEFRDACGATVLPLADALDELAVPDADYLPSPWLAQIVWEARRLDISLLPPSNPKFPLVTR